MHRFTPPIPTFAIISLVVRVADPPRLNTAANLELRDFSDFGFHGFGTQPDGKPMPVPNSLTEQVCISER